MKRFDYFEKLSLAARWFLPREEAESVIDDYRDILSEVGGQEEARERFGRPWGPVMELADSKKVRRWHMFLTIMVFCALTPLLTIIWEKIGGPYIYFLEPAGDIILCGIVYMFGLEAILGGSNSKILTWVSVTILSVAGIVALFMHPIELLDALFSPIERMIFGICAIVLAILCLYGFVIYYFNVDSGLMLHMSIVIIIYDISAVLLFFGAVLSVAMAKMFDSRWRAVYILCVTGIVICLEANSIFWNMSPSIWAHSEGGGIIPTDEFAQSITTLFTWDLGYWDLGYGLVLAAVGLL